MSGPECDGTPQAAGGLQRLLQRCPVREPFNGLSHFAGALLSLAGLVLLLVVSHGKPWHVTGFAIYGASLVILYSASTLLHSLHVSRQGGERLHMFDQVAIYLLIAGTYTPLCLVTLRGPWGWRLLGLVWAVGLVGITLRIAWRKAPVWLPLVLYVVMGWLSLLVIKPLTASLPPAAMSWLVAGGVVYTIGAVIFATERPRLWPGIFSAHELWHCFVLGGSACHFVLMLFYVAPTR